MVKNPGLRLFTKTWETKNKNFPKDDIVVKNREADDDSENNRPLTATLEKPTVIDIRFVGKLDMTIITQEVLALYNICKLPLKSTKENKRSASLDSRFSPPSRPLSLGSIEANKKCKNTRSNEMINDQSGVLSARSAKKSKVPLRKIKSPIVLNKLNEVDKILNDNKLNSEVLSLSDPNNNNTRKLSKLGKKRSIMNDIHKTNTATQDASSKSIKLLEPCKTCGRPDQPERFHSHPAHVQLKPIKQSEDLVKTLTKNTVQKPIAIKYKSKLFDKETCLSARRRTVPAQKTIQVSPADNIKPVEEIRDRPRTMSGKSRMLTCYLCGREFGTASLPLHEPKCLQVSIFFILINFRY